jgi:hypothetical protein
MKTLKYIAILLLPMVISCQKDPMEEVHGGNWHKQKDIVELTFEGQIGSTEITREGENGYVEFMYDVSYGPLTSVPVAGIVTSYGGASSIAPGETLDFSDNNTATITVTPGNGSPMDWTITLDPFVEPLNGEFNVADVRVFVDVISQHPEWGGHTKDDPIVNYLPEAAPEYDNVLVFAFDGVNAEGQSYGTFTHSAGIDGSFGAFTNEAEDVYLDDKYRVLPMGEGTWTRNPSDQSFDFEVVTDWDNLWDSMTQIRQMTDRFWYVIEQ